MPLLTDGLPYTGFFRERKIIFEIITPSMAKKYARKISDFTGLPLEKIINSKPFINYLKRLMI